MTDTLQSTAVEPAHIHSLFEAYANAGDLDRLMSLYEPGAALVPEPGRTVHGSDAVRAALAGFLAPGATFRIETRRVVQCGDVALMSNRWTATATTPEGQPITMGGLTAEVARRQPDGTWLIVIDDPVFVD